MIQIPVHVYIPAPEGGELRIDAFTLVVNSHGCLLAMEIKPEEGQRMRLVNPKTGVAQSGKVIHAHRSRDGAFAVAFEFDSPAPHLWSVVFPKETALSARSDT